MAHRKARVVGRFKGTWSGKGEKVMVKSRTPATGRAAGGKVQSTLAAISSSAKQELLKESSKPMRPDDPLRRALTAARSLSASR